MTSPQPLITLINWTEAELSLTDVQMSPKCLFFVTETALNVWFGTGLCSAVLGLLGVVIGTSRPVIAAIMAVHAICGALMSGCPGEERRTAVRSRPWPWLCPLTL